MILLPIRFSQLDSRWCSHLLGFNSDPKYNIYNYGCLLCCLAMALKYYGKDVNPDQLNEALKGVNAFAAGSGVYDWGKLNAVFPDISDNVTKTPNTLTDEQLNTIKTALDAGKPVILEIDYDPKTVALNMHFVLAIGYNSNDENDFTIADPLGGTQHSLKDYLGWFKPSARNTIEGFCIIDGPVPQAGTDATVAVNAKIFPELVHGSEEWDKTISKYLKDNNPKTTSFDDLDKVIAGFKSRATDAFNQLENQKTDAAVAKASVDVLNEKIANEEQQRQADQKMYLAQIKALKAAGTTTEAIAQTYEGRISELQGQIKSQLQAKHDAIIATATTKSSLSGLAILNKYFPTFQAWMNKLKR